MTDTGEDVNHGAHGPPLHRTLVTGSTASSTTVNGDAEELVPAPFVATTSWFPDGAAAAAEKV